MRDAGQGGWGSAATAASTALGTVFILLTRSARPRLLDRRLRQRLAHSGLNDFTWALTVVASFPAAMLVMSGRSGSGGRSHLESLFTVGVAAVVLVLLGGTTWASSGFWAADGAYSRWITTIIGLAWIAVVSGFSRCAAPLPIERRSRRTRSSAERGASAPRSGP